MVKVSFQFFILILLCGASSAFAAKPSSVLATYSIYKGGIKIGKIEEAFTRSKDGYTLISTTRAIGFAALFKRGRIIIKSSGLIGQHGLQPLTFSDVREGDEKRNRRAEFDWNTKQLTMSQQARRHVVPLPDGTQDRLSAMYQFMYLPLENKDALSFNMTNGGKLSLYNYRITPDQSVKVPLGTFKALYVASVPQADKNRIEIWLAVDHGNFPYKVVITDPDGGKLTQELTKFELVP